MTRTICFTSTSLSESLTRYKWYSYRSAIPQPRKPETMYRSSSNLIKRINARISLLMTEFEISTGLPQEMLSSNQEDRSGWVLHWYYRQDVFPAISLNDNGCCWEEGVVTLPYIEQYAGIQNTNKLSSSPVCCVEGCAFRQTGQPKGLWNTIAFSEGRYGYAKCTLQTLLETASATQYYGRGPWLYAAQVRDQNYTCYWFCHSFPRPREILPWNIKGFRRQRNDSAFHTEKNRPENWRFCAPLIMCISWQKGY